MQTYRVIFTLNAPHLTPWHADTIFGHLCWAIARREDETVLSALLQRCQDGDPPLLLSDGFPAGLFPRPLVPPPSRPAEACLTEQMRAARQGKALRESRWLTQTGFAQALRGEAVASEEMRSDHEAGEKAFSTLHNQINRATGTTGEEGSGNLYAAEGATAASRVVYLRVADDIGLDWRGALAEFARTGFGKRKSVGYGAIAEFDPDRDISLWNGFGEPTDANGFVSLSGFVPAASDPTEGHWRLDVKYGKLGEERALTERPFKNPLVRLLPGAAFRTSGPPHLFYGRLVNDIFPDIPDVVQYGYAFAVPLWNAWPASALADAEDAV